MSRITSQSAAPAMHCVLVTIQRRTASIDSPHPSATGLTLHAAVSRTTNQKHLHAEQSDAPTTAPSRAPSRSPSDSPSDSPTDAPSEAPSAAPSEAPTVTPSEAPSEAPTTPACSWNQVLMPDMKCAFTRHSWDPSRRMSGRG